VVIDSGSTDGTQAIAEAAGARLYSLLGTENCRARKLALENVPATEWVLIIDANERITPDWKRKFASHLPHRGRILSQSQFWFLDG